MFALKKLISFFLMPLPMLVLALGFAWYFYAKGAYVKVKTLLIGVVIWLFLISYQPFAFVLLYPLQTQYAPLEKIPETVTHVLALGGDSKGRLYESIRLYHQNKNLTIVTSGYEPNGKDGAVEYAKILEASGVPKEKIIQKPESKDTKDEARMMRQLIGQKPFILVTSAYHMPRAMALFKRLGLNPIAAPTDFSCESADYLSLLDGNNIAETQKALHEYIGLAWSWIKWDI